MAKGTGVLSGTVTTGDGQPVGGAVVSARRANSPTPDGAATTDAQGKYRIEGLAMRRAYTVTVAVDGEQRDEERVVLRTREYNEDISLPTGGSTMTDTSKAPSAEGTPAGSETPAPETDRPTGTHRTPDPGATPAGTETPTRPGTQTPDQRTPAETAPATAGTTTEPAATGTRTEPAATGTTTEPAATGTSTEPAATGTTTEPAATGTTTEPAATGTGTPTEEAPGEMRTERAPEGTGAPTETPSGMGTEPRGDGGAPRGDGGAPAEGTPAEGAPARMPARGGNGAGASTAFEDLIGLIEGPDLAPEPPVNIEEARELARLFVISMYELARLPEAINRLFTTRGANYQVGDLTLEKMDQLPADIQQKMQDVIRLRTEQFDTEEDLMREIRSAFNLGTAAVPAVNNEFGELYRRLVALAADDSNGVDPTEVRRDDPRQTAQIFNFMRDLKRAILRLTQNMSVFGTLGTSRLVDKWSQIMRDSIDVLSHVAENNVVSADRDDRAPWSLLAALTDTPRGTVKAHVVNARDGGQMLRLSVGIYDAIQSKRVNNSLGLDDESDEFLRDLFFARCGDVIPGLNPIVAEKRVAVALKQPGTLVRDYVAPLWP